jgi:hypothetical protein
VNKFGGEIRDGKFTAMQPLRYRAVFASVKSEDPFPSAEKQIEPITFSRSAGSRPETGRELPSVVIFLTQVRDQVLPHHPAQGVFQFHQLNEQIVLRIQTRRGHRRLEVKA